MCHFSQKHLTGSCQIRQKIPVFIVKSTKKNNTIWSLWAVGADSCFTNTSLYLYANRRSNKSTIKLCFNIFVTISKFDLFCLYTVTEYSKGYMFYLQILSLGLQQNSSCTHRRGQSDADKRPPRHTSVWTGKLQRIYTGQCLFANYIKWLSKARFIKRYVLQLVINVSILVYQILFL